jgi:hypothetical protein
MTRYNPMRELPASAGYRKGDVLVLCGELFGRGYANGIALEAKSRGMTVIGTTVGRRASDGKLRPLNAGELAEAEALLGGRIINVPLEAGFDLDEDDNGRSPAEQLRRAKPDEWDKVRLDWDGIAQARQRGSRRFAANLAAMADELERLVPAGANLLFVHTMAGGVPRARIFMPVMNRAFKGQGERFLSSEVFWQSDLGKLCKISFDEVTGDTFRHLLEATAAVRAGVAARGGRVAYAAYGYHGCEVLVNGAYTWQSYIPYLPGWAKIRLEEHATAAWDQGVAATVFNSPEIQTNSSALFLGVEISLYPLLAALEKEGGGTVAVEIREECRRLLRDDVSLDALLAEANDYLSAPVLAPFRDYPTWPHHNSSEQMELMLSSSARLLEMSRDPKEIVCAALSRAVFTASGKLMLDTMWQPTAPVTWLNHDIIARRLTTP